MIKFRISTLLMFCFISGVESSPLSLSISAESAIMMNADTGALLYEKKPHLQLYPASITKIATALYALKMEGIDLNQVIGAEQDCIGSVTEEAKQRSNYTLPSHWLVTDCSHMGIKRGEKLTLRDLMFGMMIASADDASNIIAYTIGNGSVPAFMEQLNAYIKTLGCKETFFNNPHGLHHPKHVTTAYDMALITKEALKDPLFRQMVATPRFIRPKTNKQESTILVQSNRLLRAGEFYYPRAIGVKTGWHSKAGSTFVAAAVDGDRTLIVVLLNVKERKNIFKDAIRLFDAAFDQPKVEKTIIQAGSQRHSIEIQGAQKLIKTYTVDDAVIAYFPAEEPKIKAFLQWENLELPIVKGQKVGELQLKTENQKTLKTVSLLAQENVGANFSYQMKSYISAIGSKALLIGGIFLLMICGIYYVSRR